MNTSPKGDSSTLPSDTLDEILHRLMYTFSPDTIVKPESYVTLDLPSAKQAIQNLLAEARLNTLELKEPKK